MAWLLRENDVLCTLEIAHTRAERRRGLLGRDGIEGALLIERARSVHTVRMRFAIDAAFCDRDLNVVATRRLAPWRVTLPVPRAVQVIEAEAGAFERWGLRRGDVLEVRP